MRTPETRNPGRLARPYRGGFLDEREGASYPHQRGSVMRLRLPPYAKQMAQGSRQSVAVMTGSDAWERASMAPFWFAGNRLLMPLGEDPGGFQWPVQGRDCVVYGFGDPEPRQALVALSAALVKAGALFVIWAGQFSIGSDGYPYMVQGDLSESPTPVFRAGGVQ